MWGNFKTMKQLHEAKEICEELLHGSGQLASHFSKYMVCGSIRRKKEMIGDIDIVIIQKPESEYKFGEFGISGWITILDPTGHKESEALGKSASSRFLDGHAIKRFMYRGISIDLYLADESIFETLVLIRTGSKEHNIRLTQLSRQKGLKLFASGKGLCKIKGGLYNNEPEEIINVVENTEDGILQNLLGRIPKPEDRFN